MEQGRNKGNLRGFTEIFERHCWKIEIFIGELFEFSEELLFGVIKDNHIGIMDYWELAEKLGDPAALIFYLELDDYYEMVDLDGCCGGVILFIGKLLGLLAGIHY